MIARVEFESIVKHPRTKTESRMKDEVLIHVVDVGLASQIFTDWINRVEGIRGSSGVFHPIGPKALIKFVKADEKKNA